MPTRSYNISGNAKSIFDKYCTGFARRLSMDTALKMFQTDFHLSEPHSVLMFRMFDKDQNGFLSQWEFAQFYSLVGENLDTIMNHYESVKKKDDESGHVDFDKTWDLMKTIPTNAGPVLTDEELEKALMQIAGEEKFIDMGKFIILWCWVKQHRS